MKNIFWVGSIVVLVSGLACTTESSDSSVGENEQNVIGRGAQPCIACCSARFGFGREFGQCVRAAVHGSGPCICGNACCNTQVDAGGDVDAATNVDAGQVDAGRDTGTDAADGGDASSSPGQIDCSGQPCDTNAGQVCCKSGAATLCAAECPTQSTYPWSTFLCDGPEDCNGNACCVTEYGELERRAQCSTSATCRNYALCHSGTECPTGQRCCKRLYLPSRFCTADVFENDDCN